MALNIISGGLQTTVQDAGRFGYQRFGFSPSGALDMRSYAVANMLVGNAGGEAALEITMLGPVIEFIGDHTIALTGADMRPEIDGRPSKMYASIEVRAGQVLSFAGQVNGIRAYLAVAGGIDVPEVMGSRSTHIKCRTGGHMGRALTAGDMLPTLPAGIAARPARSIDVHEDHRAPAVLRAVLGPQDNMFTPETLAALRSSTYISTAQSDRMACRMQGTALKHLGGADIISDGIAMGAVQVPPNGQPVIMLSDRQTTGGYAKIATVVSADIRLLAQAQPGRAFTFTTVSRRDAEKIARREAAYLRTLARRMARAQ